MPGKAKLSVVIEALESAGDEHQVYLDRRTGKTVLVMEEFSYAADEDAESSNAPDWQKEAMREAKKVEEEQEHFLALPGKFEINEWKIMERFCYSLAEGRPRDTLLQAAHGQRAFRRFKDAARRLEFLDQWYDFRDEALRQIAIDWLEDNGIEHEE